MRVLAEEYYEKHLDMRRGRGKLGLRGSRIQEIRTSPFKTNNLRYQIQYLKNSHKVKVEAGVDDDLQASQDTTKRTSWMLQMEVGLICCRRLR